LDTPHSAGGWMATLLHRQFQLSTTIHLLPRLCLLWCSLLTTHRLGSTMLGSIWYSTVYQQRVCRRRNNAGEASFCWRSWGWWLHFGSSTSVQVTCFWWYKYRYLWLYCVHSYWCSDANTVHFVAPAVPEISESRICTMIIVISSVLFSCSSHSLYDSAAIAEQASRGSWYIATWSEPERVQN